MKGGINRSQMIRSDPASPRKRPHNLSKEYTTGKTLYAPEYSKVAKVLNLSPILVITPGI